MDVIDVVLSHFTLGDPVRYKALEVRPIRDAGSTRRMEIATLDEAIAQDWITLREESENGKVQEIEAVNKGPRPILLLEGEQIVGAKQDRVFNTTILLPAQQTVRIPVSCVEQGRWRHTSPGFTTSGSVSSPSLRATKTGSVSGSLRTTRTYGSNQSEVWGSVSTSSVVLGVTSATKSIVDAQTTWRDALAGFKDAMPAPDGASGILVSIGGKPVALDYFGDPSLLQRLWTKLMDGYALDALVFDRSGEKPAEAPGAQFVQEVAAAKRTSYPSVGIGTDTRLEAAHVAGQALVADDGVVHLCAFRTN